MEAVQGQSQGGNIPHPGTATATAGNRPLAGVAESDWAELAAGLAELGRAGQAEFILDVDRQSNDL